MSEEICAKLLTVPNDIDGIIRDIDIYYKLEMHMDAEDEEE